MKKLLGFLLSFSLFVPSFVCADDALLKQAQAGNAEAQFKVAAMYALGKLGNKTPEDREKMLEWLEKSAEQGFAKAQYQVGKSYKNGEGVEKDIDKAFEYFTKAAKQNNGDAQLALGKCYLKGKGVEKDEAKAKEWFKKAIKNENDGKAILKELRKEAGEDDEDAIAILQLVGIK